MLHVLHKKTLDVDLRDFYRQRVRESARESELEWTTVNCS